MKTYKVHGTTVVDVWVEVEAKSEEEAMDYVESYINTIDYCNGTMGVEDSQYEADIELGSNDWFDWNEMELIDGEEDEDEE